MSSIKISPSILSADFSKLGSEIQDLEKAEATIEMESHIPIETFQEALKKDSDRYTIHNQGEHHHHHTKDLED